MLTVISWNANGIKHFVAKSRLFAEAPVLLVQETFVDKLHLPCVPGYDAFCCDAIPTEGRPSGGLATYIRQGLPWRPVLFDDLDFGTQTLWVKLCSLTPGVPDVLLG